MSPRSDELLAGARRHLAAARSLLENDFPENAASAAYYAMLYAARAALSEQDQNAKTHRGTWGLFHAAFVSTGCFERELHEQAQRARQLRDEADYEAGGASEEEAKTMVTAAERFVAAVAALLDA